jgi:hypothetical protein
LVSDGSPFRFTEPLGTQERGTAHDRHRGVHVGLDRHQDERTAHQCRRIGITEIDRLMTTVGRKPTDYWRPGISVVDRLIEAIPQRYRPAGDRLNVNALLSEQDGAGDAGNKPDDYRTEDVRLHRSPPGSIKH